MHYHIHLPKIIEWMMVHSVRRLALPVHFPMFVIHNARASVTHPRYPGWVFNTFPRSTIATTLPTSPLHQCSPSCPVPISNLCPCGNSLWDLRVFLWPILPLAVPEWVVFFFHLNWWWSSFAYNSEGDSFCTHSKTRMFFLGPFSFSHSWAPPTLYVLQPRGPFFIFIY